VLRERTVSPPNSRMNDPTQGTTVTVTEYTGDGFTECVLDFENCVNFDNWEFDGSAYLSGLAVDSDGNDIVHPDNIFPSRTEGQHACIQLGSGCGGLVSWSHPSINGGNPVFELRRGRAFIPSPSNESSYLKPPNPCHYDWSDIGTNKI